MVVKVALWYELWTSLMDLCWIIFLLSDLITEQALILLHAHDEMEEAPNKRYALASLMDDVFIEILRCLPARSLFCYKCICHSWRCLISDNHKLMLRLWLASSMMEYTAKETSPASPVFTPPYPSCPSP